MDRPTILNLVGEGGEQYQVVLRHMDADTASLAFGSRTIRTSLTDLSRYWYGDSLMLWRPGALQGDDLAPGMEGEGVRWLRASLARIGGDSGSVPDSGAAFFDSELEARVRDYQRQRRLSVDGIAGRADADRDQYGSRYSRHTLVIPGQLTCLSYWMR